MAFKEAKPHGVANAPGLLHIGRTHADSARGKATKRFLVSFFFIVG